VGCAKEAVTVGFGWNFYGFFIAATLWIACYFVWAFVMEARERRRDR
jgi:hypothetical protein